MNKKLTLLLCSLVAAAPVKARFSDGMIVGGIAGLATGLIAASAMTRCSNDVVVVEEPVFVERPVVIYEEPQVIYEKRVVYEPAPVCTRSCPTQAELAWRDQQVRRAEFKQLKHERKKRELSGKSTNNPDRQKLLGKTKP